MIQKFSRYCNLSKENKSWNRLQKILDGLNSFTFFLLLWNLHGKWNQLLVVNRKNLYTFRHIHTILQCSTVRLGWWWCTKTSQRLLRISVFDRAEQSNHQTSVQFVFLFTGLWINSYQILIYVCNKIWISNSIYF